MGKTNGQSQINLNKTVVHWVEFSSSVLGSILITPPRLAEIALTPNASLFTAGGSSPGSGSAPGWPTLKT